MGKLIFKEDGFIPVKGSEPVIYSPFDVVKDNVEKEYINDEGFVQSTKADGYLGTWSYDLELKCKTYYHVQDDGITEVIVFQQPFESGNETYYLIELNGYIYNCVPEIDDVIYTSYKEARLAFMKKEDNKIVDAELI